MSAILFGKTANIFKKQILHISTDFLVDFMFIGIFASNENVAEPIKPQCYSHPH